MLSLGYALLGFTLGGMCKETDPFQQGFPSCVTNLDPNGSTDPCSERYSCDTAGDGVGRWFLLFQLHSCPRNCLLMLLPSQFLEENNDTM